MSTDVMAEFTAAPGSRVDAAQKAAAQAAPSEAEVNYSAPVQVEEQFIVQTREARATHATYMTVAIPAGTFQRVLGRNDNRRSAMITCVSGGAIVTNSAEMAAAANSMALTAAPAISVPGAWLSAGSSTPQLGNTQQVIVVAEAGGSPTVVSVFEEYWD